MTVLAELDLQAFVLLRLGERRFAVVLADTDATVSLDPYPLARAPPSDGNAALIRVRVAGAVGDPPKPTVRRLDVS